MSSTAAPPSADVWLLLDDRPGHATQVRGLAARLGLAVREIPLAFNILNRLPSPLLGATRLTLTGDARAALAPPWPKLVIGMGRRVAPVARWISRASGGSSKTVLLGRKAVAGETGIDLAVTCAHFDPVPQANMVELTVPPTQVTPEGMASLRAGRADPMPELARPRCVLLFGGPTAQHALGADQAAAMARDLAAAVRRLGGGFAIVTSRRTPPDAIAAMRAAAPEAHVHEWRRERHDNPFLAYLAHADLLAVTGESESMLAEAAATAKPLTIVPVTPRPAGFKLRLAAGLRRQAERDDGPGRLCARVLGAGWITPPRDLAVMHERLVRNGMARMFDGELNTAEPAPDNEIDQLVDRIRAAIGPIGNPQR